MITGPIHSNLSSTLTDGTIKSAPARLLAFLQGLGQPDIRGHFAEAGLTEERKQQAWNLYDDLAKATAVSNVGPDPVVEATKTCEIFSSGSMIRGQAILQLSYPEQADYLFQGFTPGTGATAVLNVSTFLMRAHELSSGADRKATRKADHDALHLLEELGITKQTVRELTDAAATARSDMSSSSAQAELDAQRDDVLRRMHAWLTAWSNVARTLPLNRDQLIRLGIARRRSHKATSPVATPAVPVVAPPVVVAPPPSLPSPAPAAPQIAHEESGPQSRAA